MKKNGTKKNGKYTRVKKDKGAGLFGSATDPSVLIPEIILPHDDSEEEEKNLGGRPGKYLTNPDQYNAGIIFWMAQGMTKEASCLRLGIVPFTLWLWERKGNPKDKKYDPRYDDFYKSLQLAEVYRQIWWEERGRTNLHNPNFNSTLWMMQMTNLFRKSKDQLHGVGWARRTEELKEVKGAVDHNHQHNHSIDLKKLTKKEAEHFQLLAHKASAVAEQNAD